LGKRAVFGTNYSSSKKGVTGIFERIIWMIRKRNPIRKRLKKKNKKKSVVWVPVDSTDKVSC
jgi:hypothetical protein